MQVKENLIVVVLLCYPICYIPSSYRFWILEITSWIAPLIDETSIQVILDINIDDRIKFYSLFFRCNKRYNGGMSTPSCQV